jgi:hypothetical protein
MKSQKNEELLEIRIVQHEKQKLLCKINFKKEIKKN